MFPSMYLEGDFTLPHLSLDMVHFFKSTPCTLCPEACSCTPHLDPGGSGAVLRRKRVAHPQRAAQRAHGAQPRWPRCAPAGRRQGGTAIRPAGGGAHCSATLNPLVGLVRLRYGFMDPLGASAWCSWCCRQKLDTHLHQPWRLDRCDQSCTHHPDSWPSKLSMQRNGFELFVLQMVTKQ